LRIYFNLRLAWSRKRPNCIYARDVCKFATGGGDRRRACTGPNATRLRVLANGRAQAFYARCGFAVVDEAATAVEAALIMARSLGFVGATILTRQDWPPPSAIMTFAHGDPDENPWVAGAPPAEAIEIVAYSPEWPVLFEACKASIAQALGGAALQIEHVGSTAVPNLAAKPIIDIDLIVDDPSCEDSYAPALAALGYRLTVRERTWYQHRMLRHDRPRTNLHVFGRGCPEHVRHILFRDWLRAHPEDCARYASVKEEARLGVTNVRDYNLKKETVIRDIYRSIFDSLGWNVG
jgi:GrpB-like predicted nucleotidyltransferase (UPF0157 family)